MPDPVEQLIQVQKQSTNILASRIRKLEQREPAVRIYVQSTDPCALEAVGPGCIWIDTTTSVLSYRNDADTAWVPIA